MHTPGAGEVAELTEAFSRMRESLRQAQQRLLDAERLATIGRMASSISHDLAPSAYGCPGKRRISGRR